MTGLMHTTVDQNHTCFVVQLAFLASERNSA